MASLAAAAAAGSTPSGKVSVRSLHECERTLATAQVIANRFLMPVNGSRRFLSTFWNKVALTLRYLDVTACV